MRQAEGVKARPRRKREGDFHHGDLREQLLVAAEGAVAGGQGDLSLRWLAGRVGVTQPAVYRHFTSKDALLAEVGVRGLLRLQGRIAAAMAQERSPAGALRATGRAYVRYAVDNPGWFRLWFSRSRTEGLAGEVARFPLDAEGATLLMALVERVAAGSGVQPADLLRALWGQWHGLAALVVERVFQLVETDAERLEAAERAIDLFIDALCAR